MYADHRNTNQKSKFVKGKSVFSCTLRGATAQYAHRSDVYVQAMKLYGGSRYIASLILNPNIKRRRVWGCADGLNVVQKRKRPYLNDMFFCR